MSLEVLRSALESKDDQITKLSEENLNLSSELEKIKKRYRQFRELLDGVECRDKAEVIGENMKLKRVQEELSKEVESLRQENEKLKTKLSEMDPSKQVKSLKNSLK